MNLLIVGAVALVLVLLGLVKPRMIVWAAAWFVGLFVLLRYGFTVPIPVSVVKLYMGIAILSILAYIASDRERLAEVTGPLGAFLTEKRYAPLLALAVVAIPSAVAGSIYLDATKPAVAPSFARTVHPAPPAEITVHDKVFDLRTLDSPLRHLETSDPEAFRAHVANGRKVYYENCFYCHGDLMQGDGPFAPALNPIPTNFRDAGVIPQLQESFLFWRVAQGSPGMPEEGGPWASAMPAWEQFLSEEEMWEVILFLYDFTGYRPRAQEVHE